jgi:O-antigen/teichoic acid export membrane protein
MLLSGVLAARYLSRDGFGSLGIIQSTVAMFQVVASLGLRAAATKFLAEGRVTDKERAGRRLGLCLALSVVVGGISAVTLGALSGMLAESVLRQPKLQGSLALCAPTLLFTSAAGVVLGALAGLESFRAAAIAQALGGLAGILITIVAVPRFGLHGAIVALIAMAVVQGAIGVVLLAEDLRKCGIVISFRSALVERAAVVGLSLPLTAAGMVSIPALWCSHALLVRSPDGVAEMAILSIANQWYSALSFLPLILAQPLVSVMAERLAAGDSASVRRLLTTSVQSSFVIMLPAVMVLGGLSPWVMSLYGGQYRASWPVLAILTVAAGIFTVQSPVGLLVMAAGRMGIGLAMNLAWGAVVVAGTALMLRYGAAGVATSRAVANLAHVAWSVAVAAMILKGLDSTTKPTLQR